MALEKTANNKEILDYFIGTNTIRTIGSISFMGWVANKLDGLPAYKADTVELLGMVRSTPIGKIPDEEKVRIVKKLLNLNVKI